MRKIVARAAAVPVVVLGIYLVFRAAIEPFVVDLGDPASYAADWGGPSLPGVLAVHMGPGVVSLILLVLAGRRIRSRPGRRGRPGAGVRS